MNHRILATPAMITLALGLAACKPDKPSGTNPPDNGGGVADANGDGGDGGDGGGDGGAAGDGGGADDGGAGDGGGGETCDAKTSDAPTALFEDRVLIRVPLNVELVEDNPAMAQTYASGGFVSACDATVQKMWLFKFENDPGKKMTTFMDEFVNDYLAKAGFTNGDRKGNAVEQEDAVHTVVAYPSAGGQPPVKMYIAGKRALDFILVAVYAASPDEFGLLQPSFKASAETILVVPADA